MIHWRRIFILLTFIMVASSQCASPITQLSSKLNIYTLKFSWFGGRAGINPVASITWNGKKLRDFDFNTNKAFQNETYQVQALDGDNILAIYGGFKAVFGVTNF
jgi:hypothetical protein